MRAILEEENMLASRAWELEHVQLRGVGALFDFVGVVWSAYPNLVFVSTEYLEIEYPSGSRTTAIISYNIAAWVYPHYAEIIDGLRLRKHRRLYAS